MTAGADRAGTTARELVVGVGEMAVTQERSDVVVTYALGSCLGITLFDPVAGVGGMLHAMLPEAKTDADRESRPEMFINTGVPKLFKACYRLGAEKRNIELRVAGGAGLRPDSGEDRFQIGKRNFLMLRKLLWKNGVLIAAEDVGGNKSRTMWLEMERGTVSIESQGERYPLSKEAGK